MKTYVCGRCAAHTAADRCGDRPVAAPLPVDRWRPIVLVPCDLCSAPATWEHPDGGYRCDACPRPVR